MDINNDIDILALLSPQNQATVDAFPTVPSFSKLRYSNNRGFTDFDCHAMKKADLRNSNFNGTLEYILKLVFKKLLSIKRHLKIYFANL